MAKKKPAKKPTPEYDSERETRVLLEKVGSDVEKIAEQVASNSVKLMKLDKVEQDTEQLKADMNVVKTAVQRNAAKIDKIEQDTTQLKTDMSIVKTAVQQNATKIDKIGEKLDTVTTEHERRLQNLRQ